MGLKCIFGRGNNHPSELDPGRESAQHSWSLLVAGEATNSALGVGGLYQIQHPGQINKPGTNQPSVLFVFLR